MFISKKAIPRRTVLRGLGASLALPLLDGMVPAYAALRTTAANPVRRLGVCYVPNGMEMRAWTPKGDSRQLELSPILQPLELIAIKILDEQVGEFSFDACVLGVVREVVQLLRVFL